MKTKLLLLVITFCPHWVKSQCTPYGSGNPLPPTGPNVTYDIVIDFGATPNGGSDDQLAFEDAFLFFQLNGGNGTLTIPPGVYDVGIQDPFCNNNYRDGHPVFTLTGANNFQIRGQLLNGVKPIIRYKNCLKIGTFDPNTNGRFLAWPNDPQNPQDGFYWGTQPPGPSPIDHFATLNNCFDFRRCNNLLIKDIELDGNINEAEIGGYWAKDYAGIQAANDGIYLESCSNVSINNVNVHHFAQDGIHIESDVSVPIINIEIRDSRFDSNCRDGMSWGGGELLTVIKSQFNLNGWGPYSSMMASGIDIELREVGTSASIRKGRFYDVTVAHNYFAGLIAGGSGANAPYTSDFYFSKCKFIGSHEDRGSWQIGFAAWPDMRQARFDNCGFYGYFIQPFADAGYPNDGGTWNNCTFSDVYPAPPNVNSRRYCHGSDYIMNMNQNGSIRRFNNCRFERHCNNLFMYAVGGDILFENSQFYSFASPPMAPDWVGVICVDAIHFSTHNNVLYQSVGSWQYYNTCPVPFSAVHQTLPPPPDCPQEYLLPDVCGGRYEMTCASYGCTYPNTVSLGNIDCIPCKNRYNRLANISEEHSGIYPNPANSLVTINEIKQNDVIIIRDLLGKEVLRTTSNGTSMELNILNFDTGIYFISANGKYIGKLIKQ